MQIGQIQYGLYEHGSGETRSVRRLPLVTMDVFERSEHGTETHITQDFFAIDDEELVEVAPEGRGRISKRFVFPPLFGTRFSVLSKAKLDALSRGEHATRRVGDYRVEFHPLGPEDDPVEIFDRIVTFRAVRKAEEQVQRKAEDVRLDAERVQRKADAERVAFEAEMRRPLLSFVAHSLMRIVRARLIRWAERFDPVEDQPDDR